MNSLLEQPEREKYFEYWGESTILITNYLERDILKNGGNHKFTNHLRLFKDGKCKYYGQGEI